MAAENETSRVEAFSDGVFAIAITLLILEIRVPAAGSPGSLGSALARLWPSYLAFLVSFFTIGVMWLNHHRLFTVIQRSSDGLLGLNLLLLFGITFVPFPTAVVAEHILHEGRTAAIFYSGTFVVISIVFNVLWQYVVRRGLLGPAVDHRMVHGISRQYAFGPLCYLVALVVAWFSPTTSVVINLGLAIFFAIPAHRFHVTHP